MRQSASLGTPPAGCHQSMHLPASTPPFSFGLQRSRPSSKGCHGSLPLALTECLTASGNPHQPVPTFFPNFTTPARSATGPPSWKRSNTILIYNKGEESLPACHIQNLCGSHGQTPGLVGTSLKQVLQLPEGLPANGRMRRTLLPHGESDAKRRKKDLRIMWLDLKNTFGSVSHKLLWLMMQRLGVSNPFIC